MKNNKKIKRKNETNHKVNYIKCHVNINLNDLYSVLFLA